MKTIRELDLAGKRVLLRVDFNVPMDANGVITDDIRIRMALPTVRYALEQKARVVLCSHLGRPGGERVEKYSLSPVAPALSELLGLPVNLAPDCIGAATGAMVNALADGEALLLENLRFHGGEQAGDPEFARHLAALADVYVNDAFAVSHRAHASVTGVPPLCADRGAGFLLQKELDYFHRSMDEPERPLVALIGGAKVSSKLGALENMLARVDHLLIGGAMANTFLKSGGINVGASRVEDELLETAGRLLETARQKGVKVSLPVDVIAADRFAPDAEIMVVSARDIPEQWMALDIGPATVELFAKALRGARTIVWNGPVGAFEMDAFSRGTMALAHVIGSSQALSITGGGDSNAVVKQAGEAENITYMSTGGGAFLALMEGRILPGVAALEAG